jgi:hypothetical protein
LAGIAGFTGLLNLLLSGGQKQWVANQTLHLGLWPADLQRQSLLDWLRRCRALFVSIALILGACGVVWAAVNHKGSDPVTSGELLFLLILLAALRAWRRAHG